MPYLLSDIVHNNWYQNRHLEQLNIQIYHCYQKEEKEGVTGTFQVEQIPSLVIMGLRFFSFLKAKTYLKLSII